MSTRRAFLSRLALLGAGGAALFLIRDRLPWPPLQVRFANGRDTPWLKLPPRGGLIEIPVSVGGAPLRAAVDSGAQFSAIDGTIADRIGLSRTFAAPILAYGVSGQPSLTHTVSLDLQLPGLAVPGLRAAALPLVDIAFATGRDFQLLIGRDVLRRLVVEADYPRGRARFVAQDAYRPPRDAITVPLGDHGGAPTAEVQIEAAPPLRVLVDTGASGLLALSEDAAAAAGLLSPGRRVTAGHSIGIGGLSRDRIVTARSVRIAGLSLRDVPVQVYTAAAHAPAPTGLLGAGFLRGFHMGLDLGRDRLVLARSGLSVVSAGELSR